MAAQLDMLLTSVTLLVLQGDGTTTLTSQLRARWPKQRELSMCQWSGEQAVAVANS